MRLFFFTSCFLIYNFSFGQLEWVARSSMPNYARNHAASFEIGGKIYAGLGVSGEGTFLNDWWMYDPSSDTWTKKASFPGGARQLCASFAVSGKGYVGLGRDASSNLYKDLYEYDPNSDSWAKKANFPGTARYFTTTFVVGDTAYVGSGSCGSPTCYYDDFYRYVPSSNSWSKIANYPTSKVVGMCAFSVGQFAYVGNATQSGGSPSNDFYEYDVKKNSWSSIASMPGATRRLTSAFVMGDIGYVGCGSQTGFPASKLVNTFYAYDTKNKSWKFYTSTDNLTPRVDTRMVSIGDSVAYCFTGDQGGERISGIWKLKTRDDTCDVQVFDTTFVHDTTKITVRDTVIYYDTAIIYDTVTVMDTVLVYDTTYVQVYDTTKVVVIDTVTLYDTIEVVVTKQIYDTVTRYISVEDTLKIDLYNYGDCSEINVLIYPNPTDELVHLFTKEYGCLNGTTVDMYNDIGQIVRSQTIVSQRTTVDVRGLASGIYFIRVNDSNQKELLVRKLLVK